MSIDVIASGDASTDLSPLQELNHVEGFLYIWDLLFQATCSPLSVYLHELILPGEADANQHRRTGLREPGTDDIISWKLFMVPSTSALEAT